MTARAVAPWEKTHTELKALYEGIAGPGMVGRVRGDQLAAVLRRLDEQDELIGALEAAGQPAGADAGVGAPVVWWEVLRAMGDIVESHPELVGHSVEDALDAWCRQKTGSGLPGDWAVAVERALTGDV